MIAVFITGKQGLEGLQNRDKLISKQQAEESLYNVSFELKIQMLTLKMQNKGMHVG